MGGRDVPLYRKLNKWLTLSVSGFFNKPKGLGGAPPFSIWLISGLDLSLILNNIFVEI